MQHKKTKSANEVYSEQLAQLNKLPKKINEQDSGRNSILIIWSKRAQNKILGAKDLNDSQKIQLLNSEFETVQKFLGVQLNSSITNSKALQKILSDYKEAPLPSLETKGENDQNEITKIIDKLISLASPTVEIKNIHKIQIDEENKSNYEWLKKEIESIASEYKQFNHKTHLKSAEALAKLIENKNYQSSKIRSELSTKLDSSQENNTQLSYSQFISDYLDELSQLWKNAAKKQMKFLETGDPTEKHYTALIEQLNKSPEDYHFYRMIGLVLQKAQKMELTKMRYLPDNIALYSDHRYENSGEYDLEIKSDLDLDSLDERIREIIKLYKGKHHRADMQSLEKLIPSTEQKTESSFPPLVEKNIILADLELMDMSKYKSKHEQLDKIKKQEYITSIQSFLTNAWEKGINKYKSANNLIKTLNDNPKKHHFLRMIGLTLQDMKVIQFDEWSRKIEVHKDYHFTSLKNSSPKLSSGH